MSLLPRERIAQALRRRAAAPDGPALVAGLTAGYPSRERFREHLAAIATEADVVEICVPFSDPMADGATIQRSSEGALRQGVTLRWILDELCAMPPVDAPLLLMSYLNPLLAFGLDRLVEQSVRARVCAFIVPDMPIDESAEFGAALDTAGIALVQMVTPVTEPARLQRLCAAGQGFIYAVTATGTTGRNVAVPDTVIDYLERVRRAASVPVCAGFGIRSRDQVARLRGHVDGVIVASALVEVLERGESPQAWLAALRG
jgi:tryptophan synthase alpha chain